MKNGFTLVEVLIGLSIATAAAVSIAYTISSTNKVAETGRETFIATNLAHEGLELTRAIRDDAWLADETPLDRSDWVNPICDEGKVNEINGEVAIGEDREPFRREVTVNCDERNGDEAQFITVTSTVTWRTIRGEERKVELQERLYNWYVAQQPS